MAVRRSISVPHIPEHTEYIRAGAITFGVEFRALEDEVDGFYKLNPDFPMLPAEELKNLPTGASIHVFGGDGEKLVEYLRFDCFDKDPHYHYFFPEQETEDRLLLDTVVAGDVLPWALDRLRNRLPTMLARAGATELSRQVDPKEIEAAVPKVALAMEKAVQQHSAA